MRLVLGQFLVGMAAIEVIAMWLWARALPEDSAPEQRSARRIVVAGAVASGLVMCLIALFVPSISEIRLF
jgi:anti-sigma factor RsiW